MGNRLSNKVALITGAFYGIQSVVPLMKAQQGGSIINISSIAGFVGSRTGIAYGASKGAIRSMTKSAALELRLRHPGQYDYPRGYRYRNASWIECSLRWLKNRLIDSRRLTFHSNFQQRTSKNRRWN